MIHGIVAALAKLFEPPISTLLRDIARALNLPGPLF
jgi:hypothetical protein